MRKHLAESEEAARKLAAKPATVDVKGKVDRYAPVTIKGAVNPFDPMASLDIATSFKRVELTTLTPYSGKFAGYRIRKGRLNLDLHYRITKGQLQADNKVVVEQLQLGEKVDSPDAVSLPLKLAVALLKDSEGRITIELPVSGKAASLLALILVAPIAGKASDRIGSRGLMTTTRPSLSSTNFGTMNSEMPFTPAGASGRRASTRWMMLSVKSCSPPVMKILVPLIL